MIKLSKLNENLSLDYSVLVCRHYVKIDQLYSRAGRKKITTQLDTLGLHIYNI